MRELDNTPDAAQIFWLARDTAVHRGPHTKGPDPTRPEIRRLYGKEFLFPAGSDT